MHYITLLITLPATVFAVLFAASNSGDVTVHFWPLKNEMTLPLSVVALSMLGAGFFLGALFVWIYSRKTVFECWKESRRAARLEKELEEMHRRREETETDSPPPPKALSYK